MLTVIGTFQTEAGGMADIVIKDNVADVIREDSEGLGVPRDKNSAAYCNVHMNLRYRRK